MKPEYPDNFAPLCRKIDKLNHRVIAMNEKMVDALILKPFEAHLNSQQVAFKRRMGI